MSGSYEYDLAMRRRQEENRRRVRETTAAYFERYRQLYGEMIARGYDAFIPTELERVRHQLDMIEGNLEHDPFRAREYSQELGGFITRLPGLARATQREFAEREQQRMRQLQEARRQAEGQLAEFVQAQWQRFHDPVSRDFAFAELQTVQAEVAQLRVDPAEMPAVMRRLEERITVIQKRAEERAAQWKAEKEQELRAEAVRDLVSIHEEQVAKALNGDDPVVQEAIARLAALAKQADSGQPPQPEALMDQLKQVVEEVDDAVVDERCRREAVRAVMAALEAAGFVLVTSPKRQRDGEHDEVVIVGRRPGGNQAEFRVGLTGDFTYTFDGYEGAACKKDIDQVIPMLQEVYGFQLSKKRVIWENPDRVGRTAKPITDEKGHGHGR